VFKQQPYENVASELAFKAAEIREAPDGDDYDYEGLARATGFES
jgi:hypothetical protein